MGFLEKIKSVLSFFSISVLMFVFIYSPRLAMRVPLVVCVSIFSIMYICINFNFFKNNFFLSRVVLVYLIFFIFAIYLLLVSSINDNGISGAGAPLNWVVTVFPTGIMLCMFFIKKKESLQHFIDVLLVAGIFQALIAVVSFFSPEVHKFFSEFQASLIDSPNAQETFLLMSNWRNFGFASNLSYSTPVVQAALSVLALYFAIEKNYKYLFAFPILLFSALINARTSFVVFFVGFFLVLLFCGSLKKIFLILVVFLASCSSLFFLLRFLYLNGLFVGFDWVFGAIDEILLFVFRQEASGYFSYIVRTDKWLFPEGLGIFFGLGLRIMQANKYGVASDIGFVNDFWLGGATYFFLINLVFFYFLSNFVLVSLKKFNLFVFSFFMISFLFLNIKGCVFSFNNFTNLFFVLYIRICLQRSRTPVHSFLK